MEEIPEITASDADLFLRRKQFFRDGVQVLINISYAINFFAKIFLTHHDVLCILS